ncbi:MAG TPA: hypothetical protein VNT99_01610 [Methylomirabilota bacterium]|nr:hypothetical protein [Methylomirabilota bacterium]
MYWWRIEPLKSELASGAVSESEKLKYLIAMLLLYVVSGEVSYLAALATPEDTLTTTDWLSSSLLVITTFIGAYYCYGRNRSGDAKCFLERFVCLSWPITIRFLAIMLLGFAALFGFGDTLGGAPFEWWLLNESLLGIIVLVVFQFSFYWYLGKHIHGLATRNT